MVGDDLEVLRVVREQRHAMDVGGRCDGEIQRSAARLTAALGDDRVKPTTLARRRRVERQRVEVALDRTKSAHPQRTRLIVACNEHAEVQLG
ncbi:MAG TPA: hypothetical protein VK761_08885 [Solirubrobacteraceae bacterium]|nr:hypothetical protein [Solirubrobacteraceae bacterium]